MDPNIIEPIMAVFGMLSIGSLVLIGMKMRYQYKSKMLEQPKSAEEIERLADAMDSMYEQTRALREDIGELQERLDFHERLLTRPKDGNGEQQ
jgi:predicted  nucleic acid-binding Zn-ribbon protein